MRMPAYWRRVPFFEIGAVVGEWQRERLGQNLLRIGVAAVGLVDGGEGAQEVWVAIEVGFTAAGKRAMMARAWGF
jgi:hypothetical protein